MPPFLLDEEIAHGPPCILGTGKKVQGLLKIVEILKVKIISVQAPAI